MYNIFHSILESKRTFRFCIDHVLHSENHKLTVRTSFRSTPYDIYICQIHKFHGNHNLSYTRLESNLGRSNGDHKHKNLFQGCSDRDLNSPGDTDRLADQLYYNLRPASLLCRNSDPRHNFHDQNSEDQGNQL